MSKKDRTSVRSPIQFAVPTRSEAIRILIEFDYEKYQPVAELIKQLCGWSPSAVPDDVVRFNYTFAIEYFGSVEKHLDQVLTILGQAETAVVSVDSELIDGTTCLIARIVEKLRQIQTMATPREA
jgi:hypothetical protein